MRPFSQDSLKKLIEDRNTKISNYINSLSDEEVLSEQDEVIINNMYEEHKFILVDIKEEIKENQKLDETLIKKYNYDYERFKGVIPNIQEYFFKEGVKVTCQFPFLGDSFLFKCQPSTISLSGYPEIELFSHYFTLSASETLEVMKIPENKNKLFERINRDLTEIKIFIEHCNSDARSFNESIKNYSLQLLNKRKEKATTFNNISKILEIPIKLTNPKIIEEIKINRTIVPLERKKIPNTPEYCISDDDYKDIITMIKHQGSTFERTPKIYHKLMEEELRDIFLGSLNGYFKGKANGECFRKNGKTDILIEYENRAAFVAECKFWAGKKVLESALNQLQSYTTWRDNKLCLIIFSKNKDFFKVLSEIKMTLPLQDNYLSINELDKNEFEYKIKSRNNDGQVLKVRVFAFNLSID